MADYKASILQGSDYRTTAWSGGTTTELSIAPEKSVYADRDFEWRLSSATVELEESDFTSLPDYNRIIMTLKGGIKLSHNGGEWFKLPEFVPHFFDGKDETKSVGKVIDFNLMLKKGKCTGEVVPCLMKTGEKRSAGTGFTDNLGKADVFLLYCYDGAMTVTLGDGEAYELLAGDTLKVEGNLKTGDCFWKALADVSAVAAAVNYL